jgi:hypothetical protein
MVGRIYEQNYRPFEVFNAVEIRNVHAPPDTIVSPKK